MTIESDLIAAIEQGMPVWERHEFILPFGLECLLTSNPNEIIVSGGSPGETYEIICRTHTAVGPYDKTIKIVITDE